MGEWNSGSIPPQLAVWQDRAVGGAPAKMRRVHVNVSIKNYCEGGGGGKTGKFMKQQKPKIDSCCEWGVNKWQKPTLNHLLLLPYIHIHRTQHSCILH